MNEPEKAEYKARLRRAWRGRGAGDIEIVKSIAPMMRRLCEERGIAHNIDEILAPPPRQR